MIIILIAIIAAALLMCRKAEAEQALSGETQVACAGCEPHSVKWVDSDYENFRHISVKDTAAALAGTDARFDVEMTEGGMTITRGSSFSGELVPLAEGYKQCRTTRLNVQLDGRETRYYAVLFRDTDDAWMLPCDIALMLGIDVKEEGGTIVFDPSRPFVPDLQKMYADGYFQDINTALCGDADTGEIWFESNADAPFAIASTTKIMTCVLVHEELRAGHIHMDDIVTVSPAAQQLAENDDGTIPLKAGQTPTVSECLKALMLPSSNEVAFLLAEFINGSEAEFVKRMNAKAQEIGMNTCVYYNAHGLPDFSGGIIPAKRSNHMSGRDMFRLARYVIKNVPEMSEITSLKTAYLPTWDKTVNNTNQMLWNIPEADGIKTGTTNKAGACLVTSVKRGGRHAVSVMLGAEDSPWRVRASQLIATYALSRIK